MWNKLLLILLMLGLATTSTIKITCQSCSCSIGTCLVYDGGLFNNNSFCTQCTLDSQRSIDIGCSCSLGCGYSLSDSGNSKSGCATSSDPLWPYIQLSLDSAYAQAGNTGTYNWCGGVCVGPIIGVVIGVLAGVGIIIGVIVFMRRRQAARQRCTNGN